MIDKASGRKRCKAKQILLSYVRAEAAGHALALKAKLTHMGYSVYLVNVLRIPRLTQ